LKVVFSEGYYDIYINGDLITTHFDDTLINGSVGTKAWYADGEFDYFYLSELNRDYSFGNVGQSEYLDIIVSNNNVGEVPGVVMGQQIDAPTPTYGDNYTYTGDSRNEWLSSSPTSGTIPAGESEDVTVTFDATDLSSGDYSADIVISSNDPDESAVYVPVSLMVTDQCITGDVNSDDIVNIQDVVILEVRC
jgi:hypothetical protein